MKNTILIILSVLFFKAIPQPMLTYVPTEFCAGDSIDIKIYYDGSPGYTSIKMQYSQNNGISPFHIWAIKNDSIWSYHGVYTLKLKTEYDWPHGDVEFRTSKFDPSVSKINCTAVGIEEIKQDIKFASEYYDFDGNKVEPTQGKLLIEKTGRKIKKVYIQ